MTETGQPDYMRLLPRATTASLSRLELTTRGAMEGFVTGRHTSPYKGFSVEFAEHRQYVPGDDIRDLDWRVYGKSDRYYIKQFIEETNLRATLLVDASGSMAYAGKQAAPLPENGGKPASKFEYAQHLAAALSYLLIRQQDAVGIATFDTAMRRYLPARSRGSHLRALLQELHNTSTGNESRLAPIFHDIADRIRRRGLVIILSDLFDKADEILKALHHFRYRKHEVILFHVTAEEELTFPYSKWTRFKDLENASNELQLDPRSIRAEYLDRFRAHVAQIEKGCGEMTIDYVPMCTKDPYDLTLANYLGERLSRIK